MVCSVVLCCDAVWRGVLCCVMVCCVLVCDVMLCGVVLCGGTLRYVVL